jgi:hypothetical protein
MVVFMAGVSCEPTAQAVTLTYCDYVLATAFLGLVFIGATADKAQYAFPVSGPIPPPPSTSLSP